MEAFSPGSDNAAVLRGLQSANKDFFSALEPPPAMVQT